MMPPMPSVELIMKRPKVRSARCGLACSSALMKEKGSVTLDSMLCSPLRTGCGTTVI
jgi:hypothetical protein